MYRHCLWCPLTLVTSFSLCVVFCTKSQSVHSQCSLHVWLLEYRYPFPWASHIFFLLLSFMRGCVCSKWKVGFPFYHFHFLFHMYVMGPFDNELWLKDSHTHTQIDSTHTKVVRLWGLLWQDTIISTEALVFPVIISLIQTFLNHDPWCIHM